MTRGLVVLGTDTDVGKTVVCGALALALGKRGIRAAVFKPFASDCGKMGGRRVSGDALWFKRVLRAPGGLLDIGPVCYRLPLAPWPASWTEGKRYSIGKIMRAYRRLRAFGGPVLVEGIGGVLVPLSARRTIADLCARLKLPAVLVGRAGLGTINHTLLSIEALESRNVKIKGIILNMAGGCDPAESTNPRVIQSISGIKVLSILPRIGKGIQTRKCLERLAGMIDDSVIKALFGSKS